MSQVSSSHSNSPSPEPSRAPSETSSYPPLPSPIPFPDSLLEQQQKESSDFNETDEPNTEREKRGTGDENAASLIEKDHVKGEDDDAREKERLPGNGGDEADGNEKEEGDSMIDNGSDTERANFMDFQTPARKKVDTTKQDEPSPQSAGDSSFEIVNPTPPKDSQPAIQDTTIDTPIAAAKSSSSQSTSDKPSATAGPLSNPLLSPSLFSLPAKKKVTITQPPPNYQPPAPTKKKSYPTNLGIGKSGSTPRGYEGRRGSQDSVESGLQTGTTPSPLLPPISDADADTSGGSPLASHDQQHVDVEDEDDSGSIVEKKEDDPSEFGYGMSSEDILAMAKTEDGHGWKKEALIALRKRGIRPIPSLHGPSTLPYARCPSGIDAFLFSADKGEDAYTFVLDPTDRRSLARPGIRTQRPPLPGNARYAQPYHLGMNPTLQSRTFPAQKPYHAPPHQSYNTAPAHVAGSRIVSSPAVLEEAKRAALAKSLEEEEEVASILKSLRHQQSQLAAAAMANARDWEAHFATEQKAFNEAHPLPGHLGAAGAASHLQHGLVNPYPHLHVGGWNAHHPAMSTAAPSASGLYGAPFQPLLYQQNLNRSLPADPAIVFGPQSTQAAAGAGFGVGRRSSYGSGWGAVGFGGGGGASGPNEDWYDPRSDASYFPETPGTTDEGHLGGFFFPLAGPGGVSRKASTISQATLRSRPSIPIPPLSAMISERRNSAAPTVPNYETGARRSSLLPAATITTTRRSSIAPSSRLVRDSPLKESKPTRQPRAPPTTNSGPSSPSRQPHHTHGTNPPAKLVPHHARPGSISTPISNPKLAIIAPTPTSTQPSTPLKASGVLGGTDSSPTKNQVQGQGQVKQAKSSGELSSSSRVSGASGEGSARGKGRGRGGRGRGGWNTRGRGRGYPNTSSSAKAASSSVPAQ